MKQMVAILFCALLVWTPFAPAQAAPTCGQPLVNAAACGSACSQMACCAAKPASGSQPAPAVPAQKTGAQNQISFLASTSVAWTLPDYAANSVSSLTVSTLTATGIPLFARNCIRLL